MRTRERSCASSIHAVNAGPIIHHADVRRMLLTMKALTQASRMICLATAGELDVAARSSDPEQAKAARNLAALLTPVAKAFSTDIGCEVASLGVQVHGGMGFVEETGAAQYLRDARILPIYEGTNGIQAIDLVMRKLPLEGGAVMAKYLGSIADVVAKVMASNRPEFGRTAEKLNEGLGVLEAASKWMGRAIAENPEAALAGATPYLRLFGLVAGGAYLAKGALADAGNPNAVTVARFFAENCLTAASGLAETTIFGAESVLANTGVFA